MRYSAVLQHNGKRHPSENRPGYTLAEYTTICNSIYAAHGIKCINFAPICSENALNYESLTDAELTVTHVHENRFFAERLAEYVLNANFTQTQEFYYHGNNAFTSLLFPTNIASIDDLKATPLNYVGTNSFKFTAGSHISNHTFTANPEQNINFTATQALHSRLNYTIVKTTKKYCRRISE